ncbi:hypothetical protein HK102_011302, partial [Quaeritorhiza haematococci]
MDRLAVDTSVRGQGIRRRLVAYAETVASQEGFMLVRKRGGDERGHSKSHSVERRSVGSRSSLASNYDDGSGQESYSHRSSPRSSFNSVDGQLDIVGGGGKRISRNSGILEDSEEGLPTGKPPSGRSSIVTFASADYADEEEEELARRSHERKLRRASSNIDGDSRRRLRRSQLEV